MRNAQKAALMAMFAAMEERKDEAKVEQRSAFPALPDHKRSIVVDLDILAQRGRKPG